VRKQTKKKLGLKRSQTRENSAMSSSLVKYNTPILVQQLKGGKKSKPKANGEH
jgi:hypothetical protein